jgi:excisionase family DNA binding protein
MTDPAEPASDVADHFSTIEVAKMLGMAVRSVQLMVDRGDLEAWKTPGGHRRISRASVERWIEARRRPLSGASAGTTPAAALAAGPRVPPAAVPAAAAAAPRAGSAAAEAAPCVLLIEDSKHYQTLVSLLMRERFPQVRLEVADDGIAGLAMAGSLQPRVLIVDILLPGIDGATLIMSLRSHPQFAASRLVVITSLDDEQRAPYRFALEGVPVVHKTRLVAELPPLLERCLATQPAAAA